MKEVWKDIPKYKGIYQASNLGRIRKKKTNKIIHPYIKRGYFRVTLTIQGEVHYHSVHSLVAEAFYNIPPKARIIHINKIKSDNRVENLKIGDQNEVVQRTLSRPILQYTVDGELVKEYPSIKSACDELGIYMSDLWRILNGKRKTINGFTFKYKIKMKDITLF